MPQQSIYLTDEMYLKLKDTKNRSALVNKLLNEWFNTNKSDVDRLIELEIEDASKQIEKEIREKYERKRTNQEQA